MHSPAALVEVTQRLDEQALRALLALSVGFPTPEKLGALAARYAADPAWSAYARLQSGRPVGVIGLQRLDQRSIAIQHLAVAADVQRQGIGRDLLQYVRRLHGASELHVQTDAEAAGFYQRCGFAVVPLGELYPGVERFHCHWPG